MTDFGLAKYNVFDVSYHGERDEKALELWKKPVILIPMTMTGFILMIDDYSRLSHMPKKLANHPTHTFNFTK